MAHPNVHPPSRSAPAGRSSAPRLQHLAEQFGPLAPLVERLEHEENELIDADVDGRADRTMRDRLRAVQRQLTAAYSVTRASALASPALAEPARTPTRRAVRPALPSAPGMEETAAPSRGPRARRSGRHA